MAQLRRHPVIAMILALAGATAAIGQPAGRPALEVLLGKSFGTFRVVNHGSDVSLSSEVELEQKLNGAWKNARVTNFELVTQCDAALPSKCVSIRAGSTLQPVAWRGNYCYSQCPVPCDLDGELPAGTYRFVIRTCDRRHYFVSPDFEKRANNRKKTSASAP